jgi:predicted ATP-dependent endonuclease of OLD family
MRILFERRPRLLLFGDDARLLQSEYALDQIGTSAPTALRNLARLGGLNLETLKKAITEEDHGHVETLVESANRQLGQIISETWTQSGITVRLRLDGTVLRILTGRSGTRYVSIAERSDGLRQFIALLCFAALEQGGQGSILLIDEAETHLHYDAQADLVQMFARQAVVAKVIYTTHSIGCLPEDLGTGVRLIEPSGPDRSTIRNWFWEDERSGFSPLLFGMGASTLAFVPVRFAILTEGVTDIILLPTLLREATGRSYLGFQIAPGLSRASEDEIALLEHEAPRTAYLLDSDAGGDEICKKLRRARIPDVRILRLSDSENQGLVVEDLIDADAYLAAVNEELRRSHGSSVSLSAAELTEIARPTAVRTWCKSNGVDPPNKRAVAYGLLELRGERRLLAEQRQALLEQLYLNIINALKFPQSA